MTDRQLLAIAAVGVPALSACLVAIAPRRTLRLLPVPFALVTAAAGLVLGAVAVGSPGHAEAGRWVIVDTAAGLLVIVIAVVGLASVLVSPGHLRASPASFLAEQTRDRTYYAAVFAFWAVLAAVALAGNLGEAWLLLETTTAVSAILVGFSGRPRALEAAWKYLILTTLGLGVALLGIILLAAGVPGGGLDALTWQQLSHYQAGTDTALVAYLLVFAGLAAKIGWAPVHNWLPDAHSEAPPPVSALLSGVMLPAALLVAWRSMDALAPVVGSHTAHTVPVAFGLVSLAVAVPFLWRGLPWKRLLAYSSLEHMGVIALGIGFATPLALAGVVIHVVGHAVAKALGFYAATPLLASRPRAARHPAGGVARAEPSLGATMGISLGTLAGLPPSPLFVSELLIIAGGFQAGREWAAGIATVLLALGFLGLIHALIEITVGRPRSRSATPVATRGLAVLAGCSLVLLLGLTIAALWLPGSHLVHSLPGGLG